LQEEEVRRAFGNLDYAGRFYSEASGKAAEVGYYMIRFTGDTADDDYLAFESLESLPQEHYETREPNSASHVVSTSVVGLGTSEGWSEDAYVYHPHPGILRYEIKRNTAFVLMPMDRENPALQDV
jgi:hypothetical protein